MEATLLTVGLVCLVAAVVGGGLKILGNEVPVLQSVRRQIVLGIVGASLIGIALWDRQVPSADREKVAQAPEATVASGGNVTQPLTEPGAGAATKPANLNSAQQAQDIRTPNGSDFRNLTQEAQYRLIALGFDVGYPDGLEGPKATRALETFQRQHNLAVSGTADTATLEILRARSRKAFLVLKSDANEATDYQKRWLPAVEDAAPEE